MISTDKCDGKNDIELVELTLKNQDYFLCLMNKYQHPLLRYIRRISGFNLETAEDILQEVFIKIYLNLNDFDPSLKFSSWIYRITRNQVISSYRKIKSRPQAIAVDDNSAILDNLASNIDIEKDINSKIDRQIILKILNSLDIKYREVLILKFLEDKSYEEISDILKKPVGTIGTLINRAKIKFKKILDEQNVNMRL